MSQNTPIQRLTSTVVVSRPGVMRQSLRSILTASPHIQLAASAGDGLTALKQVQQLLPQLLVIDSNLLDEEVELLLAEIKAAAPATRCLVCVTTAQRQSHLLTAGADAVILRHSSRQQWQETLSRVLQQTPP